MPHCGHEARASLYALGLLDPAEAGKFETHLRGCAACQAETHRSGELGVHLAQARPMEAPPEGLKRRVLAEAVLPRGVVALVRGQTMDWQATDFPGVSMARLYRGAAGGGLASLVRMAPGAKYPSHHHGGLEHCYVLEGDLVFEDHTLRAGDYAAGGPGADHTAATTTGGCLLFIVHDFRDRVHAV